VQGRSEADAVRGPAQFVELGGVSRRLKSQ